MPPITIDYQKLFADMPVPRLVMQRTDNGDFVIIQINAMALKFFDVQDEALAIDQPLSTIIPKNRADHFLEAIDVSFSKKCAVTIKAAKSSLDENSGRDFTISPILDNKQNVIAVDVLGHLKINNQLNLQRERDDALSLMSSIFDVSEIGIVVTDSNRKIIRVNESFIRTYGWQEEQLINNDLSSFVTPDLREEVNAKYHEFIQNGLRSTGELKLIRQDGSVANILYTTATIDLSQRRRFQVTTMMDITLRKRMEESLRSAKEQADSSNQAKSTFLANMSHELRTPLNAIIGFSEIMIEGTFGVIDNPRYNEYVQDIHNSANHLLEIINEVLDMSKIEAGKIDLEEEPVNIAEVLEDVTRMLDSRAFSKDVTFIKNIQSTLPQVKADKKLLRQIFINIIANAIKFSKDSAEINIDLTLNQYKDIQIQIQDQGIGIEENKIKQALEPFGQVFDNAQHSSKQGSGLGLPLAKAMVELHGGTLDLKSSPDKGTCVTIILPSTRIIS